MNGFETIKPGLWTTIQDGGRWGLQKYGVSPGGAMDHVSYRAANWLVGNSGDEAALELTQLGPQFVLRRDVLIAVSGADMRPTVDGHLLPMNRAVLVRKGGTLAFGGAVSGCRAYMAVAGGIDAPLLLGGRGAYPSAGLPGLSGRVLRAGDRLNTGSPSPQQTAAMKRLSGAAELQLAPFIAESWSVQPLTPMPDRHQKEPLAVRAVIGQEYARLTDDSKRILFEEPFIIRPQSDRMGYRLKGSILNFVDHVEMISEAVPVGTLQLPSGGEPILLMADRQTTGGYVRLLHVIAADLPALGQLGPGHAIRFRGISIAEAQRIYKEQQHMLRRLERWIKIRWTGNGGER